MAAVTDSVQPSPALAPPSERNTIWGWLYKNLFSSWFNSLLTVLALALLYLTLRPLLSWVFTSAEWAVIPANMSLFMRGRYPAEEAWRIWLCLDLLALLGGFTAARSLGARLPAAAWVVGLLPLLLLLIPFISGEARIMLAVVQASVLVGYAAGRFGPPALDSISTWAWLLYFPGILVILRGFGESGPLPLVPSDLWGGLTLSLILAAFGIAFSFPIGVLLALGRQSKMPAIRTLCVLYIEFIRGVPLITLLFMGVVMLQLFLPPNAPRAPNIMRVAVAITLFSAAYTAENVRGGLQSVPKGQYEAAHALGLNSFQSMFYIVLPQALRAVIPVLVGQFIGLFKDTTLVALVGLSDLFGISRGILANPDWLGKSKEVYVFLGLVYWLFCYGMAYASRRIEDNLNVDEH